MANGIPMIIQAMIAHTACIEGYWVWKKFLPLRKRNPAKLKDINANGRSDSNWAGYNLPYWMTKSPNVRRNQKFDMVKIERR